MKKNAVLFVMMLLLATCANAQSIVRIHTANIHRVLLLHSGGAADRTLIADMKRLGIVWALFYEDTTHLGDDLAGLIDGDGIPDADV